MKKTNCPAVPTSLRITAASPSVPGGVDIRVDLAAAHTFLCPECPNVHFQVDGLTPAGMKIRVSLQVTAQGAEELAMLLSFPDALREEDAEEDLA
jgi:hypothetical protein